MGKSVFDRRDRNVLREALSETSTVLALASICLKRTCRRSTYIFIASTDEPAGLVTKV